MKIYKINKKTQKKVKTKVLQLSIKFSDRFFLLWLRFVAMRTRFGVFCVDTIYMQICLQGWNRWENNNLVKYCFFSFSMERKISHQRGCYGVFDQDWLGGSNQIGCTAGACQIRSFLINYNISQNVRCVSCYWARTLIDYHIRLMSCHWPITILNFFFCLS